MNVRPVERSLSTKSVGEKDIVTAVNREVTPLLREVREKLTMSTQIKVEEFVGDGTISDGVDRVLASANAAPLALTLPGAGNHQREIVVIKTDPTANAVTVPGILGITSINTQYAAIRLVSDGLNWYGT